MFLLLMALCIKLNCFFSQFQINYPAYIVDNTGNIFYLRKYGRCVDIMYMFGRVYIIGGYGYEK